MARQLSGNRELVYAAIVAAADAGRPCPTNTELGRIGGGGTSFGVNTIQWLTMQDRISVEHFGNQRRVMVTATGKRTLFERPLFTVREGPPLPPRVDRDPCPRCGVRRDIGCAHGGVTRLVSVIAA